MRKRLKKTTKRALGIAAMIAITGAGGTGGCFYMIRQIQEKSAREIAAIRLELDRNVRYVYETSRDIRRGEILNDGNTRRIMVYASMPSEHYLGEEDMGTRVLLDISEGVHLLKDMIAPGMNEAGEREIECEAICLNDNRKEYDVVDVRLRFPNGEDYVVLAKKMLLHLEEEIRDRCYLQCSEEEIARLSAAYVDTAFYDGAILYTAKYILPELQEASLVTYLPTADALEAMKENPNIVSQAVHELSVRNRSRLEARLNSDYEEAGDWEILAEQAGNPAEAYRKENTEIRKEEMNGGRDGA